MAELPRKVEINLAAIPVTGFGGMCMVVASLACAVALPPTRWFMLAAIATGIVFGVAMILIRRAGERDRPTDGGLPFVADNGVPLRQPRRGPTSLGRLRAAQV